MFTKKSNKLRKQGFTIIETLIASLILITIVSSMSVSLSAAVKLNTQQSHLNIAQSILEDTMSREIKNQPFEVLYTLKDNSDNSLENIVKTSDPASLTSMPVIIKNIEVKNLAKLPPGSTARLFLKPVLQGNKLSDSKINAQIVVTIGKRLAQKDGGFLEPRKVELATVLTRDGVFGSQNLIK